MADSITDAPAEDAKDTTATDTPKPTPPKVDAPAEGEESLGDPGKKALDAMKAERKAALDRAKIAEAERDRFKAASEGREAEWKAEREAEEKSNTKFAQKYLRAEMKAAAKGVLADPGDAFLYLNISDFEVSDDGDVDSAAIASALETLIANKPYLAVQDGKRFAGTPDAGTRNASAPGQLTQADLANMTTEQINKARREGRLKNVLGGRS